MIKYDFVKCLLCNAVYIPRAGKKLCLWEACKLLSCFDGKRSRCVNGRQQQKVVTRAESGVLSFHLGLEMSLKAPTHPPCYSCGEEFKELTAVN